MYASHASELSRLANFSNQPRSPISGVVLSRGGCFLSCFVACCFIEVDAASCWKKQKYCVNALMVFYVRVLGPRNIGRLVRSPGNDGLPYSLNLRSLLLLFACPAHGYCLCLHELR